MGKSQKDNVSYFVWSEHRIVLASFSLLRHCNMYGDAAEGLHPLENLVSRFDSLNVAIQKESLKNQAVNSNITNFLGILFYFFGQLRLQECGKDLHVRDQSYILFCLSSILFPLTSWYIVKVFLVNFILIIPKSIGFFK